METLPTLGLDLDGVIVRPPLGWNVAISRRLDVPPLPARARVVDTGGRWRRNWWLARTGLEIARYSGRTPMPGAVEAVRALARVRRLVVVSGRCWVVRPLVERWLTRHGMASSIDSIHLNDRRLRTAQFKLWTLRARGIGEHVDDDGATVWYLATHGAGRVYLCDWPRNRGLPYPPAVQPVRSLVEVAERLLAEPRSAL